ncbi:MAG: FAD-dependent 5-carboxymethylaminomethyl-2-thiouridine(34) oxidoreductase MnmC [Pseudomonadota bacterium]
MARLPAPPDLDWTPEGTPVARQFDDVYFTTADGLEEARAVFLAGCGLPERWQGRRVFTVAETGFGTGLNFLALWDLWRRTRPSPTAQLHFVSFEAHPLAESDAARALSAWPELSPLAERALARWPACPRGVRSISWPGEGVSLTLHIGDIAEALPRSVFSADAWFLDGFSPSRNASMWDQGLYPLIAARTAPGGVAATFTVARAVREGLSTAGFEVSKQPGFGRKRERLEARFAGSGAPAPGALAWHAPASPAGKVAIIGAGIAGACVAREARSAGLQPALFDPKGPGAGASGNPLALIMPRLDAGDTPQARLLIDAYLHAQAAFQGLPGAEMTSVHQSPRSDEEAARFAKVLADPPLPLEDLEAVAGGGLLHKRALVVRPKQILEDCMAGVACHFGAPVETDLAALRVNGDAFDAIVLASGMGIAAAGPWLGLTGKLGQVEHAAGQTPAPASAVAAGHYALAWGEERLWGATYAPATDGEAHVSAAAQAANAAALETLAPWWHRQASQSAVTSHAGIRATTPDRLPVAGALPDIARARRVFAPLARGQSVDAPAPCLPGVYLVGGLGSRGFTFAPWLARLVIAGLTGAPIPAARPSLEAVSPMRFILRGLKRGTLNPAP